MTIQPPSPTVILAARHLDTTEGRGRKGHTLTDTDVAALNTVLRYVAQAHNHRQEEPEGPSTERLTARAEGYRNAANNAAELVQTHGSDADAEMLVVFLQRGAELREQFAAAQVPS